jgi:hypothetical protein
MDRVAPDLHYIQSVSEELTHELSPASRTLLRAAGLSRWLEINEVAATHRFAGRVLARDSELASLLAAIRAMGVGVFVAPFGFHGDGAATHPSGGFRELAPGDARVLYLCHDLAAAEHLAAADLASAHELVGEAFGYPQCCVCAYVSSISGPDRAAVTADDEHGDALWPAVLNPVLRSVYGIRFTFHFPCSFACEQSLMIADRVVGHLGSVAPALVSRGEGLALHGPATGAWLAIEYEPVAPMTYRLDRVVVHPSHADRLASDRVCIRGPHDFEVGDRVFRDREHMAARFAAQAP